MRDLIHASYPSEKSPTNPGGELVGPPVLAALNPGETPLETFQNPNAAGAVPFSTSVQRGLPISFSVPLNLQKSSPRLKASGTGEVALWKRKKDGSWTQCPLPFPIPADQAAGQSSDRGTYMIQGISPGIATLKLEVGANQLGNPLVIQILTADLDVDSDNTGTTAANTAEERVEDDSNTYGQIVLAPHPTPAADSPPLGTVGLLPLKVKIKNLAPGDDISIGYDSYWMTLWKTTPSNLPTPADRIVSGTTYTPAQLGLSQSTETILTIQPLAGKNAPNLISLNIFSRGKNHTDTVKLLILPVELISDLNNDGEITAADNPLRDAAMASGAPDEIKDKGTEFIFHNDTLSNGIWDKEDTDPAKPADADDDDDAEAIFVGIGSLPDETLVFLDHPAWAGLKYYRDRKCTEEIPLSLGQPHVVGGSVEWPDDNIMFVRAESVNFPDAANPQVEGDLRLMIKLPGAANGFEATKMKLTIIKGFGAKKYFHGARDYIFENNTHLFVHEKKYPTNSPSSTFRICVMREESASLWPIEAFYRNPQIGGIDAAVNAYPLAVLLNGNQVDFKDGTGAWAAAFIGALGTFGIGEGKLMTDTCHGRLKERSVGTFSLSSSDNYDSTTMPMAGSVLAGPDPIPGTNPPEAGGKYVAQLSDDKWTFAAGVVPNNLTQAPFVMAALGGLSTYYDNPIRDTEPQQFVGYAPLDNTGKGCVFTASQISGAGHGEDFADDAEKSGVPNLPGGSKPSDLSLFILDSGDTSVAVAHVNPAGTLKVIDKGLKHNGIPYFVNTYLGFYSEPPRP